MPAFTEYKDLNNNIWNAKKMLSTSDEIAEWLYMYVIVYLCRLKKKIALFEILANWNESYIHFPLLIPYFCRISLQEIKILDQAGNRKQHQKLILQGITFHSVLSILVVHFTNCMNDLTPAKLFQSELLVHELCIEGTVQIYRAPTNLQTHWY